MIRPRAVVQVDKEYLNEDSETRERVKEVGSLGIYPSCTLESKSQNDPYFK